MNVFYIQYDVQTGQIFVSGNTDEAAIAGRSGFMVVDRIIDNTQYKVENGQIVAIPPKPGIYYYYDYTTGQWVYNEQENADAVINQRNYLLYQSDWTQIPNNPLTPEVQQEWAVYRQALRDIPQQPGFPANVVWPTPPQG